MTLIHPSPKKNNLGSAKILLLVILAVSAAAILYAGKKANQNIKVVEIPPGRSFRLRPVLAQGEPGGTETFTQMVNRLKPYAAINGTYYDVDYKPMGDIVINGKRVNKGGQTNAIAVSKSGRIDFIRKSNRRFGWSGYESGLAAGPRLIHKGKIVLDPVADGFSKRSLKIQAWRSGVGTRKDGTLLLVSVTQSISLDQFAQIMLELRSVEAMNLDGGGACGLYKEGKTLVLPTLPMTNMLVVYKKK